MSNLCNLWSPLCNWFVLQEESSRNDMSECTYSSYIAFFWPLISNRNKDYIQNSWRYIIAKEIAIRSRHPHSIFAVWPRVWSLDGLAWCILAMWTPVDHPWFWKKKQKRNLRKKVRLKKGVSENDGPWGYIYFYGIFGPSHGSRE